ncbi:MAG: methyltransferase domain-containing protein [Myxococcales bacterium]|nr:methyltransferase domain-containing protein [Myxococcales bacterium]
MTSNDANETRGVIGRASRPGVTAVVEAHLLVLKGKPMRSAISETLAKHSKLGGNDRRFVAFATRELSRHQRLLDLAAKARGRAPSSLKLPEDQAIFRYALWRKELTGASVEAVMAEVGLPGPVRPRSMADAVIKEALSKDVVLDFGDDPIERAAAKHSFPNWMAKAIAEQAPAGELDAVLAALNREPFLTMRVRPNGTRETLLPELIAAGYPVQSCPELPDAIRLNDEGRAIFESRWMKEGRLLVMDLGSQLLADLCRAAPGQTVVDYCAGAGGKTIFLADAVGPNGRVYAHDTSAKRLVEAKERAAQLKLRHISFPKEPRLDLADLALVDAPCSGVGTLAREPDQKWKLTKEKVLEFQKKQLEILDAVVAGLKPGGVIVYGTCSLLRDENDAVVEQFLAKHPECRLDGEPLRVWPNRIDGGGFFGARLVKQ